MSNIHSFVEHYQLSINTKTCCKSSVLTSFVPYTFVVHNNSKVVTKTKLINISETHRNKTLNGFATNLSANISKTFIDTSR